MTPLEPLTKKSIIFSEEDRSGHGGFPVSNPKQEYVFLVYKTFLSEKQIFDKKCLKEIKQNEKRIKDEFL